jgi:hypothetical protein
MKFTAIMMLIDLGKASKRTRGLLDGPFFEAGAPPNNRWS